jgi:plastocyanin
MPRRTVASLSVLVCIVFAACALVGCGSSSSSSSSKGCVTASPGGAVTVVGKSLQFSTGCIRATAGSNLTIVFENQDSGTPHDFVVDDYPGRPGTRLRSGPNTQRRVLRNLREGSYHYLCTVHASSMHGTLDVTAPSGGTTTAPGRTP